MNQEECHSFIRQKSDPSKHTFLLNIQFQSRMSSQGSGSKDVPRMQGSIFFILEMTIVKWIITKLRSQS